MTMIRLAAILAIVCYGQSASATDPSHDLRSSNLFRDSDEDVPSHHLSPRLQPSLTVTDHSVVHKADSAIDMYEILNAEEGKAENNSGNSNNNIAKYVCGTNYMEATANCSQNPQCTTSGGGCPPEKNICFSMPMAWCRTPEPTPAPTPKATTPDVEGIGNSNKICHMSNPSSFFTMNVSDEKKLRHMKRHPNDRVGSCLNHCQDICPSGYSISYEDCMCSVQPSGPSRSPNPIPTESPTTSKDIGVQKKKKKRKKILFCHMITPSTYRTVPIRESRKEWYMRKRPKDVVGSCTDHCSDLCPKDYLISGVDCYCLIDSGPSPTLSPTFDATQSKVQPTSNPSISTTLNPATSPTKSPTPSHSRKPTSTPTAAPTKSSAGPTNKPTSSPTEAPTKYPTDTPTKKPTSSPTDVTSSPTDAPTKSPMKSLTTSPTDQPSASDWPTSQPSESPSTSLSPNTTHPTTSSTKEPTDSPTEKPTKSPTKKPSESPTKKPTSSPTASPTAHPQVVVTEAPTSSPTKEPTDSPTEKPTDSPKKKPTISPTDLPTSSPIVPPASTSNPSKDPTTTSMSTTTTATSATSSTAMSTSSTGASVTSSTTTSSTIISSLGQIKLNANESEWGDYIDSVAMDGNLVVVSVYGRNGGCSGTQHSAYVFENKGSKWIEQAKLVPNDELSRCDFGNRVAIHGHTVLVGAYGDNYSRGAVYVFSRSSANGWVQQAILTADDGRDYDYFGSSVAIYQDTVVISAPRDTSNGLGSAYIFVRDTKDEWAQQAKLTADDGGDWRVDFTYRISTLVAIYQDTVVVGAPYDDAAYVYVRDAANNWVQQAKLTAGNGEDEFGTCVAIHQDTIVIGAPEDDTAYVFERDAANDWVQQANLAVDDGEDKFGTTVAIHQDNIIVGAFPYLDKGSIHIFSRSGPSAWTLQYTTRGEDIGTSITVYGDTAVWGAHIFVKTTSDSWVYDDKADLVASDRGTGDEFGYSVDIHGDTAIVGAPFHDLFTGRRGSVYIFMRREVNSWLNVQGIRGERSERSFGSSVAIHQDTAIIGAPEYGEHYQGAAFIYARDASGIWKRQQFILGPPSVYQVYHGLIRSSDLGTSVGIYGDVAIVGAPGYEDAYIFRRDSSNNWNTEQRINWSDSNGFGTSVAVSPATTAVVVGSHGAAYVFVKNTNIWSRFDKLVPSDGDPYRSFGRSVAIYEDDAVAYVVVGAYGNSSNKGAAYVFEWIFETSSWAQSKLTADDGAEGDYFGFSVSVYGETVTVGAPGEEDGETNGFVYVFEKDSEKSWIQKRKILAYDGKSSDMFGRSVAIHEDTIIIGATGDDDNGDESGSAYVMKL